jgi:1-piperideine-2-carboxylate/1-pyrroline-2-carboxylate reductase [NAD(P)H]
VLDFASKNLQKMILNASETAARLPYVTLATEIERMLQGGSTQVPERIVQPLAGGASLFVMPATDGRIAITKLISLTPANASHGRATIQGDVIVFNVATGERIAILDGPTITARRTAAVSLLAAQRLAPNTAGPLLIVGAGVQGRAHLEAFTQGLGFKQVIIASRSAASAQAFALHARSLGLQASITQDPDAALRDCPLVVTCTPASGIVLSGKPRDDAFIAAVGAFKPSMVELAPALCQHIAKHGQIALDTSDAAHEAGDLIQAGLDVSPLPTLAQIVRGEVAVSKKSPVLFKSCGWAGWDLAAASLAIAKSSTSAE